MNMTTVAVLAAVCLAASAAAHGPSNARWLTVRGGAARDAPLSRLARARQIADAEQAVEDYNAEQKFAGSFHRRMVVMPLTEQFEVPPGQFGHGKMEAGDKVLP
jgi:hypothetical protein